MYAVKDKRKKTTEEKRPSITFQLDPDTMRELDDYRASIEFPPSRAEVSAKAIKEFIEQRNGKK